MSPSRELSKLTVALGTPQSLRVVSKVREVPLGLCSWANSRCILHPLLSRTPHPHPPVPDLPEDPAGSLSRRQAGSNHCCCHAVLPGLLSRPHVSCLTRREVNPQNTTQRSLQNVDHVTPRPEPQNSFPLLENQGQSPGNGP